MPPTVVDLTLAKSPSPAPPSAPVLTTAKIVIPKLPRVDAVLLKELATTPEDRLRRLVLSICQANSEAALMAEEALLVPESEVNYQAAEESTEDEWSEEEEEEEEEEDEEDKEGKGETEKEEGLDGKKTSKENNASGKNGSGLEIKEGD
ncbi:hypothetical protein MMC31_004180 [Peltigera leucophlebia]|nr:hypothetical protein [Peltigera leucophlebia]